MKGKDEWTLVAGMKYIKMNNEKTKGNRQFFSKVQCSGDSEIDVGFQFSTTAEMKVMMSLTDEQLKPLDKVKDIFNETHQV